MSIYQKLQTVRCEVNKKCNKKSGHNKYAGFDYFQLEDFLPTANEEFLKVGLCPVFSIHKQETTPQMLYITNNPNVAEKKDQTVTKEFARLRIFDDESNGYVDFETPIAEVKMGSKDDTKRNPIQELGASHTYLKRYLYMNALELSEGDVIDATIGKNDNNVEKPTSLKLNQFYLLYNQDEISKILEHYKVSGADELPRKVVDEYIKNRKDKLEDAKQKDYEDKKAKPLVDDGNNPFY